jgi:hypothetical protein
MKGATATIWSYTTSLEELCIQLQHPYSTEPVRVLCNSCDWLQGPTHWLKAELEFRERVGEFQEIVDEAAGFLVRCRLVRIDLAVNSDVTTESGQRQR